jgi:hypothetical protein
MSRNKNFQTVKAPWPPVNRITIILKDYPLQSLSCNWGPALRNFLEWPITGTRSPPGAGDFSTVLHLGDPVGGEAPWLDIFFLIPPDLA